MNFKLLILLAETIGHYIIIIFIMRARRDITIEHKVSQKRSIYKI